MAYTRRTARDDDPTGNPGGLCAQILKLLEEKLDPRDFDEVGQLVSQLAEVANASNVQNAAGAMDRAMGDRLAVMGSRDPVRRLRQLLEAEREVQPVVGAVSGMDSAEMTYGVALSRLGVSTDGISPTAFGAIFRAARDRRRERGPTVVMDAAGAASLKTICPDLDRIRTI